MMPTRAFLLILVPLVSFILVTTVCIGHDFRKGPILPGCRLWLVKGVFYIIPRTCLVIAGIWTSTYRIDYDYSKYLGPDYKET